MPAESMSTVVFEAARSGNLRKLRVSTCSSLNGLEIIHTWGSSSTSEMVGSIEARLEGLMPRAIIPNTSFIAEV